MTKEEKELSAWKKQVEIIPLMISCYCHGVHKTKKGMMCQSCQELNHYALVRLDKCPFKKNKQFCSGCTVHCYEPNMRKRIKEVMRYSGPRMLFTHPILAISHCIQTIRSKKKNNKIISSKNR